MKFLVVSYKDEYADRCGDRYYSDHRIESFDNEEDAAEHIANLNTSKVDQWDGGEWEHWVFDQEDFGDPYRCSSIASNGKLYGENFDLSERVAQLEEEFTTQKKAAKEAKEKAAKEKKEREQRERDLKKLAELKSKYE